MKLVIAGASGFIGSMLVARLLERHHALKLLTRNPHPGSRASRKEWIVWEPGSPGQWEKSIDGVDGIINLAGEPIAGKRWSAAQ